MDSYQAPDGAAALYAAAGKAQLTAAEQLSFVSALAVAAAEAFLRDGDRAALAREAERVVRGAAALPPTAMRLPLAAYVKILSDALLLTAVADAGKQVRLRSVLLELAQLVRTANCDQREAIEQVRAPR